jgi:hypothetical protein
MKTAIQELIEWLNDYPTNVPTIHKSAVISKAESMLEKEKEQMVDFAFKYGDLTTRQIADSFDKEYKTNEKCQI